MSDYINIPTGVLLGGVALLVLAALIYLLLRVRASTKNVVLQQVIDGLMPYIYKGILAAEKIAQAGLEGVNAGLKGADKHQIAASIYNLLPDMLIIGPVPVPIRLIKRFVSLEEFETLIEQVYQESSGFITRNEAYLRKQVDYLVPDEIEAVMG